MLHVVIGVVGERLKPPQHNLHPSPQASIHEECDKARDGKLGGRLVLGPKRTASDTLPAHTHPLSDIAACQKFVCKDMSLASRMGLSMPCHPTPKMTPWSFEIVSHINGKKSRDFTHMFAHSALLCTL